MRRVSSFLVQSVVVGLVAAAVLIWLGPRFSGQQPEVVEVREHVEAARQAGAAPVSYADAVARAAPAVVNIYTAKVVVEKAHPLFKDPLFRHFFGDRLAQDRKRLQTSLGSGVVIGSKGYILTNNHVVADADQIKIMLSDGRSTEAEVIGTDPDTDLAVLKVDAADLPTMVIGNSEALRVGDVVLAIGNPFGVGQTVTLGIVSATGRTHLGINAFENFIQTDAAINPGNSGGALINASGELIGINTAIFSRSGGSQGIGFAIPVSLAKDVMKQIIEQGRVIRGWLGIEAQDLTPSLAESLDLEDTNGLLIAGVMRGGPADEAGLEPGDVVTRINGTPVPGAHEAMNLIAQAPPGSELAIEGIRNGQPFRTRVRIAQRPANVK